MRNIIIHADYSTTALAAATLLQRDMPEATFIRTNDLSSLDVELVKDADVCVLGISNVVTLDAVAALIGKGSLTAFYDGRTTDHIPSYAKGLSMLEGVWLRSVLYDIEDNQNMPIAYQYLDDHRARTHRFPETSAFMEAIYLEPNSMKLFHELLDEGPARLLARGEVICEFKKMQVRRLTKDCRMLHNLWGFSCIPVSNVPRFMVSSVLKELAHKYPLAINYHDHRSRRYWSVRTSRAGIHIGDLCKRFGGGGGSHHGGFTTDVDMNIDLRSFLISLLDGDL